MLWQGDIYTGFGSACIALLVTATLTLIGLKVQPGRLPRGRFFNALLFACYAPGAALIVEAVPAVLLPSTQSSYLVLVLLLMLTVAVHFAYLQYRAAREVKPATIEPLRPILPGAIPAFVLTHSTSADYHQSIVKLEEMGSNFCFVQYRIAPYFLPEAAVEHVANLRFGAGNPLRDKYIEAQTKRRNAFNQLVARGASIREIYPRSRIMSYVATGTHLGEMWPLTPDLMVQLLQGWRQAISSFPNYTVAIADESVPMKYHLIDGKAVVLHEPIGRGDSHRLNSVFVLDADIGSRFASDFELVWDLIEPNWRDSTNIVSWIDDELLPLARQRTLSTDGVIAGTKEQLDGNTGRNHGQRSRPQNSKRGSV